MRAMRGRELGARKMDGAPGMGAEGSILVPTKFHGSSRGSAGVKFLVWAPIFSYGGSGRGSDGVALRIITCTYHLPHW